jgi:hypothetical protein
MSCPQLNWLYTESNRELHEGEEEEQCENGNEQKCHHIARVRILGPRIGLEFEEIDEWRNKIPQIHQKHHLSLSESTTVEVLVLQNSLRLVRGSLRCL